MTKESDAFERQIHRLLELLEDSGATITWNDRVADPDNLERTRQIDITIRRDSALTIVECRHHKDRQDVQWIEELIGRKASLRAELAIAVSSSGFTEGAVKKANAFGIVLRDLPEVTADEVRQWGCTIEMRVLYYEYCDLKQVLVFKPDCIPKLDLDLLVKELERYCGRQSLFNASAEALDQLNLIAQAKESRWVRFAVRLQLENFRLCGEIVEEVDFSGSARLAAKEISLPLSFAYGNPNEKTVDRDTLIQTATFGETGFVTHNAAKLATVLDLSAIALPQNCQFRYVSVSTSKTLDMDSFELIGGDRLYATGGPVTVEIASRPEAIGVPQTMTIRPS